MRYFTSIILVVMVCIAINSFANEQKLDKPNLSQSSTEIDLSAQQEVRIKKLNEWGAKNNRPALVWEGFCNGDAFIWAYSKFNGTERDYLELNKETSDPNLDIDSLEKKHNEYMSVLRNKKLEQLSQSKKDELKNAHERYLTILQYYENILLMFQPQSVFKDLSQGSWANVVNRLAGLKDGDPKALVKEASFGIVLNEKELASVLKKIITKNKIIMLTSSNHAMALFYDGINYSFYDPNIGTPINRDQIEKLSPYILKAQGLLPDDQTKNTGFGLHIIDRENSKHPNTFYSYMKTELLQKNHDKKFNNKSLLDFAIEVEDSETIKQALNFPALKPALQGLLPRAVKDEKPTLIQVLIDIGVDINKPGYMGKTALNTAISKKNIHLIKLLLDNGASIDAKDVFGNAALHEASLIKDFEIFKLLLSAKKAADINVRNESGETALHLVGNLDQRFAQLLLENGANPNIKDKYLDSYAMLVFDKNFSLFQDLFKRNLIDVNLSDGRGNPILQLLVEKGEIGLAILFLNKGANPNIKVFENREELIHWALQKNNSELLKALLKAGANGLALNQKYETTIEIAANSGKIDIVEAILNNLASPDVTDEYARPLVSIALDNKNLVLLKALFERCANINITDETGESLIEKINKVNDAKINELVKKFYDGILCKTK